MTNWGELLMALWASWLEWKACLLLPQEESHEKSTRGGKGQCVLVTVQRGFRLSLLLAGAGREGHRVCGDVRGMQCEDRAGTLACEATPNMFCFACLFSDKWKQSRENYIQICSQVERLSHLVAITISTPSTVCLRHAIGMTISHSE